MFKEAFESEQERGQLLKTQLEAALTEKLGSGTKISIDAIEVRTPQEAGGTTWRDAYEAAKKRTDDLEQQLVKARGMGQQQPAPATAPGPAPGPAPAVDPAVAVGTQPPAQEAEPVSTSFQSAGTDDQMEQVRRLQEVSNFAAEEEAVLRLIAVAVLPNRGLIFSPEDNRTTTSLQPVAQVREAIGDSDYRVQETIVFERCYVFKGSPVPGKSNAEALENVRARVRGVSAANATELFLQPTKDGQSMILMLLEEDLPEKEVPAWNWAIAIFLLLATLVAANSTTLAVVPVSQSMINNADPEAMLRVASKLFPTAAGILTTVGASELARRATAGAYGVQLSPPFFIPAWPFPSVGCLAAISRRLTPVPSKESELAISAAAASTGLAVSLAFMVYGLALGPDTDLPINLNFQLLPALMKLLLKPLLGTASVSDQPDPFLDPVSIAFPANPYLIGGICGLIITSLSLLPVGRLDGGVLARSAIGSGASGIVGFLGLGLLAVGSFSPGDDGTLYLSFGVASLIWQSGSELPAREAVSEAPDGYKALAVILLVLGFLLCIPGAALPNI